MNFLVYLKFVVGIVLFLKIILNIGFIWDIELESKQVLVIRLVLNIICWITFIWIDYILLKTSIPVIIGFVKQYI